MSNLDYQLLTFSLLAFLASLITAVKAYEERQKPFYPQPRAKYQRER